MKQTSACLLLSLTLELCCTTSQARLTLHPSRSQFFQYESVTLSCEDENSSAGWTVRSNTSRDTGKECGTNWGKAFGSFYFFRFLNPCDSGLYWCESSNGSSSSSSINLTVGELVILHSPVLPVMEGDDVTLRCRAMYKFNSHPAAFFKDGVFIGNASSGHMTLLQVSSYDEGLYHCSISGYGESPSSRISVKENPPTSSPTSSSSPPATSTTDLQSLLYNFLSLSAFSAAVSLLLVQL
ncbi:Fc receptor-like B [Gambusia affinis]|uniref:Fc receptor-like B n=1 Tax=Gambusia affinis TaxID=33528 RepID=UPI001CDD2CA8|nr:Fc receptor-like B [Gambusia affinis]